MLKRTIILGIVTLAICFAGPAQAQSRSKLVGSHDAAIRRVVKRFGPAVIGISCTAPVEGRGMGGFFGTGVLIRADGLALTSLTVIPKGARDIRVYFKGGEVRPAELIAADKGTESVLISAKLSKKRPFVELANSAKSWVGQRAYTFGNPFHVIEYDGQVAASVGIISGIYQITDNGDDTKQSVYHGLTIETDAAVNPGSDGGPLLDGNGRLLGIISLGFQRERKLGTVIPVHLIRKAIKQLGKVKTFPTPTLWEDDSVGAALAVAAHKIEGAVVELEIDRAQEKPWAPRACRSRSRPRSWLATCHWTWCCSSPLVSYRWVSTSSTAS